MVTMVLPDLFRRIERKVSMTGCTENVESLCQDFGQRLNSQLVTLCFDGRVDRASTEAVNYGSIPGRVKPNS